MGIEKLKSITNLKNMINNSSTIFIDLDETLITSKTNFIFGNPKCDKFIQHLERKLSKKKLKKVKYVMENIYYQSEKRLVESQSPLILSEILSMGCKLFGITGNTFQSHYSIELCQNLTRFGIKFTISEPNYQDGNVSFVDGIFYTSCTNKGEAIKRFFEYHANYEPTELIFIDDSLKKCEDTYQILKDSQFKVKILHYIASFDCVTHKGMKKQFSKILSEIH